MNDRCGKRICKFCLFKIISKPALAQFVGIKHLSDVSEYCSERSKLVLDLGYLFLLEVI
jgi:hypothetical protein